MAAQSYTQTLENKMDKVGCSDKFDGRGFDEWQRIGWFPKTLAALVKKDKDEEFSNWETLSVPCQCHLLTCKALYRVCQ